jgi:uncharacterized spore protein YtfJ
MEANFDQMLDKVSQHVKDMVKTETIVGEEFTMGEFTCKPVIKVGLGFGSGGGKETNSKSNCHGNGEGAGAGIGMSPVGFLVTKGNEISFLPTNEKKGLQAIFDKVPDLIEKIIEMKKESETKK